MTPNPATFLSPRHKEEQRLAVRTAKVVLRHLSSIERKTFQNPLVGLVASERRFGRRRTRCADLLALIHESIHVDPQEPARWLREIIAARQHPMPGIPTAALADIPGLRHELALRAAELAVRRARVMPRQ